MVDYLTLKLIHIICAVIVTGTGVGIAFFMLMTYLSKNLQAIYVVSRVVVLADWLFTAPAVTFQFITGIMLVNKLGWSFDSTWFLLVLSLFVFIGVCWIPVILIQYRLKTLAKESLDKGRLLPSFHYWMRWWMILGLFAFSAIAVIFYLMIFKPLAVT